MDIKNMDHLIIKSKVELDKEYDDAIREKGKEMIEWAQTKGLTPKDLAVVAYNYYRYYQDEVAKHNLEKAEEK